MMIFDLILDQTLGLSETRDYTELFEPMFKSLGVDPEDYNWNMPDPDAIDDLDSIKAIIVGNLIYAAQDIEMFPSCLDAEDFCFEGSIVFDMAAYTGEEEDEIRKALKEFESKTGLKITIEE